MLNIKGYFIGYTLVNFLVSSTWMTLAWSSRSTQERLSESNSQDISSPGNGPERNEEEKIGRAPSGDKTDSATRRSSKGKTDQEVKEDESLRHISQMKDSSRCRLLTGFWCNELGSELTLLHNKDGMLTGEYRTAVEVKNGSAGDHPSRVIGFAHPLDKSPVTRSTLGFTVSWKDGESTTSWTGQCKMCDGREILQTMWVLTSNVDTCDDLWKANRIGQDVFWRKEARAARGFKNMTKEENPENSKDNRL